MAEQPRRSVSLRVQLSLAFVVVALLSVVVVAFWARQVTALQIAAYHERILLAAVAHELQTPLSIIEGNLEAMLDGVREPTPDLIATLHTQSALLSQLVTDLRDLSLADARQLSLSRRPVDLVALCRESVDAMSLWIEEHKVTVEVRGEGDTTADVDPDRLRQVVQNLLHNAVRFTPAGGQVRITVKEIARDRGRWVALEMEDEGPGIPPENLTRVFEPFYRADPSRSRASGGTGMGLAVVRLLVQVHGGDARAENRPGGGSVAGFLAGRRPGQIRQRGVPVARSPGHRRYRPVHAADRDAGRIPGPDAAHSRQSEGAERSGFDDAALLPRSTPKPGRYALPAGAAPSDSRHRRRQGGHVQFRPRFRVVQVDQVD